MTKGCEGQGEQSGRQDKHADFGINAQRQKFLKKHKGFIGVQESPQLTVIFANNQRTFFDKTYEAVIRSQ